MYTIQFPCEHTRKHKCTQFSYYDIISEKKNICYTANMSSEAWTQMLTNNHYVTIRVITNADNTVTM